MCRLYSETTQCGFFLKVNTYTTMTKTVGGGVLEISRMPVLLADYIWVISLYATLSFWLVVIIDGHILPAYVPEREQAKPTLLLFVQFLLQVALQGFIAILLHSALQMVPSPLTGIGGYDPHGPEGTILRNPAIISVILFSLSKSLQGRLQILFSRFDRNALVSIVPVTTK